MSGRGRVCRDTANGRAGPGRPAGVGTLRGFWGFRRYGSPEVRVLLVGILLRVGELLADLAQPWPLALIIDSVLGDRTLSGLPASLLGSIAGSPLLLLSVAVGAILVLAGISGGLDYLGDRLMNGAGQRISAAIRRDLFAHLQRLPLVYHDRRAVGELSNRVSADTGRIEEALVDVFSTLLPGLLTVGGLLVATMVVDWRLGLVIAASLPLIVLTFFRYTALTRAAAVAQRAREGELSAEVVEALSGIRTIQALGRHDFHDHRFRRVNDLALAAGLREVDLNARFTPLVEASSAVGIALLLWVGAWGVLHGLWTLGLLLVVISYLHNMVKPIRSLSRLSLVLSRAAASAERVRAVMDEPVPGPSAPVAPARLPRVRGEIEILDVTFGYGGVPVLHGVSLYVPAGERVAVLGPNGSGKSSLLSLVARLYRPQRGAVLIDGTPVERLPLEWLRRQVAVVPQETFLFSGTLWDNIAYARPGADPQEVHSAAEHALVADFARDLPEGLETIIWDGGVGLSGGERQRVAIARALLSGAPIVLLDEPTSGLDLEAERAVIDGLRLLMEGRTVLMATHRPALLDLAHRIVSLEGGRVISICECSGLDPAGSGRRGADIRQNSVPRPEA